MTRPRRGRPADLDDARALPEEVIIDDLRSLGSPFRRCRTRFARHHGVTSRTRTTTSAPSVRPSVISVMLPSVNPIRTSCGQNAPSL